MFSQNPFFSSCTSWVAAGSCYVLVALKHLGLGFQLSLKVILGQSMSVLAVWIRQSRWPSASNPNHSDEFKHSDSHDLQSQVIHHQLWNHPIRFDLIHSDLIQLAPIKSNLSMCFASGSTTGSTWEMKNAMRWEMKCVRNGQSVKYQSCIMVGCCDFERSGTSHRIGLFIGLKAV